jgi:hypothetical protein
MSQGRSTISARNDGYVPEAIVASSATSSVIAHVVNLDNVVVSVERSFTAVVDGDRVTMYDFAVRLKHCFHETRVVATDDAGASFSLACPECVKPVATQSHRFSTALHLFETMKRVGGNELPAIPTKKMFSRFNEAFIEQRRRDVEGFIQAIVCNSFFVRHPHVLSFLGIEEDRNAERSTDAEAPRLDGPDSPLQAVAGTASGELPQNVLSHWRRGSLLGKGAYGSVFLGLLPHTSQLIAVKVLRVSSVVAAQMDSLQAELNLLRELNHVNVVQLLGAVWSRPAHEFCIFTEYVECGSIAKLVKKFGKLPYSVMQRYLEQALRGLAYLHEKQVVHRDIKGDNILVAKDGSVKLADFGCSARLREVCDDDVDDAPGLAGTPMWMSPEAMRGEQTGTATDIWSLGCVAVEMLNRAPWVLAPQENVYSAMYRFQKSASGPDGCPPEDECPSPFYSFVQKCFQRDAAARPSAVELLKHEFFQTDFVVDDDE